MKRLLYFAYGSNLSIERLQFRVGEVGVYSTYTLQNYELYFSNTGFANIRPKIGASVEGVLYIMSPQQHKELDNFEGLYIKEYFDVENELACVYIESKKSNVMYSRFYKSTPTPQYFNFIIEGALHFNLVETAKKVDALKRKSLKLKSYKNFFNNF